MNTPPLRPPRLYELVLENGRSASPYVWRTRYALAHKGLQFESVPLGFCDIPAAFGGRFATVPVLEDGATMLAESWDIAEYLDRSYPGPQLFCGPGEIASIKLLDAWLHAEILRRLFKLYLLDIHNAARPADRAYFRASRERRLGGRTLEEFTAERAAGLAALRTALTPLRMQLAQSLFLGGASPTYADYITLAAFLWVASVSTLPLLAADDQLLRSWFERGLDLHGGCGRDSRMQPLFAP